MKKLIITVTLTAAVLGLGACSSDNADSEVVVKTKAGNITKDDFYQELKERHGAEVLQDLVTFEILNDKYEVDEKQVDKEVKKIKDQLGDQFEMALQQQGFKDEDAFRDVMQLSLLQEAAVSEDIEISEDELKKEYERENSEVKVQHIVVADEETAKEVKKKLDDGGDFAKLAKEYSTDEATAKDGGKMDYISVGETPPEIEDTAFSMKKGEVSEPVQTQQGFQIIKVNDVRKKEESIGKFADVKDELRRKILNKKVDPTKAQEKIAKLIKDAKVDVKIDEYKDLFKNEAKEETEAKG